MEILLLQFAASEHAPKADLLSSLGIDGTALLLHTIAFLLLLIVLKKWVYPPLVKSLDARQQELDAGLAAARQAKQDADAAEARTAAMIKAARDESESIIASAKQEATALVTAAEQKASSRAEQIVEAGRQEVQNELTSAKQELRGQLIDLVAEATAQVTRQTVTAATDRALIEKNLGDVR